MLHSAKQPMNPLKRQETDHEVLCILKAIELLRLFDKEIPCQVVSTFLYIASHNPCHKQALEEDLGFTTASASRNTDWLTTRHRLNKPGLSLIKKFPDESDRRRTILCLSEEGKALINQLKETLYA